MKTLGVLRDAVGKFGDAPFLIEESRTLSFRDVDRLSSNLALSLRELGVAAKDRVALYMNGASEFVIARLGTQKLGAWIVPVNTRLLAREVEHILSDCEPKYLVADVALLANLPEQWRKRAITVGREGEGLARYEDLVAAQTGQEPRVELDPEDGAMILYTSGTTGRAKGAVIRHRNSCASGQWILQATGLKAKDVLLSCIPMYSASSMNGYLIASLMTGTPWVITEKFSPEDVLKKIEERKVTVLHAAGAQHGLIANHPSYATRNLSSLRLLTWSNVLPLDMLKKMQARLAGIQFIQFYGMTETSPIGTHISTPAMLERPTSCGKPMAGFADIRLVDSEGNNVSPETPGEISIRSSGLMKEYYKNPEATREAVRDGWFYTGDLGRMDGDGYLYIVGRINDVINRGGEKIFAPEVESVLLSHSAIQDAALVGIGHSVLGEEPKAFVVKKPGAEVSAEELRQFCQGKLARFKIPSEFEFLNDLPKNSMGKTLKYLLKEKKISP
ncbi:MAG: acyl--CoA ligase [Deltaproteobacteria bacterium]|nr:acyl--CoA ligase [Deltaproteobacteria bacterium]